MIVQDQKKLEIKKGFIGIELISLLNVVDCLYQLADRHLFLSLQGKHYSHFADGHFADARGPGRLTCRRSLSLGIKPDQSDSVTPVLNV